MQNSDDNAFEASVPATLHPLLERFFETADYAESSRRAVRSDLLKFGRWYCQANHEPLTLTRVTTRDCADFRDALRREQNQAVPTVNRCLVSLRRFFGWLKNEGLVQSTPLQGVKELRKQELAPKTLDRSQVRKLLREAESRVDVRATAIFSLLLYCGCRVSELCGLDLADMTLSDRSGWAVLRHAKGNKQRQVPLPFQARKALQAYLESRPPLPTSKIFVGERGPLTTRGVRAVFAKYSAIVGIHVHPHLLRHIFGHEFLAANQNDLVGLAALMGHENLNTTKRYVARTAEQLQAASERMGF